MGFRRIAADQEDRSGIVDVVVGVGHRAIAPGVGNTRDSGGVTDTRLVIDVVRPPIGSEFANQIGLLVGMLGRTQPINGIGPAGFANLEHLVADSSDISAGVHHERVRAPKRPWRNARRG